MTTRTETHSECSPRPFRWWWGAAILSAIAVFFLWQEHRAHLLGVLPWLLVLACPLMHVFMHGGHGHGGATPRERDESPAGAGRSAQYGGEP